VRTCKGCADAVGYVAACSPCNARHAKADGMSRAALHVASVHVARSISDTLHVALARVASLHRCAWFVASAPVELLHQCASCVSAPILSARVACLHRCALHVPSTRVADCFIGAQAPTAHPSCGAFVLVHGCRVRCPIGRRAGFAHRRAVARCARAQSSGGVLAMIKGTALFDTVAISGTAAANVRAG
jgi:hypothetical protein